MAQIQCMTGSSQSVLEGFKEHGTNEPVASSGMLMTDAETGHGQCHTIHCSASGRNMPVTHLMCLPLCSRA